MRWLEERKHLARNWAPESLRVKYQWPEECDLKFDISPSTQTAANRDSSETLIELVSCDTVIGRRSVSSKSAEKRGWDICICEECLKERQKAIAAAALRRWPQIMRKSEPYVVEIDVLICVYLRSSAVGIRHSLRIQANDRA